MTATETMMGSLFRSEEMTLCQLFLQAEAAYACVSELGELGLAQFHDLNPAVNAFQRKFVNEVRRCEEMERKLRFLEKEIKKDNIPVLDRGDNPDAPAPREMIDLEATFEKLENEMKEINANAEALKRNFLELTELKHILRKTQNFFDEALSDPGLTEENVGLLGEEGVARPVQTGQALRLGFVAGVILRERMPAFERMLWRVCRGNVFLKQTEIEASMEDPITGDQVNKNVFIAFFQGDQLKARVKKICEGFRATLYPCPEHATERREMAIGVMTRIEDLNTVLGQTQDHRRRVLVAVAKNIKVWQVQVLKIKAIYHTLNMCNLDVTQKCLIGELWCPVRDLDKVQMALRRGTERSGSSVPSIVNRMPTKRQPPTFNRTNKFTGIFQSIVDAFGVATYLEINPALFTIISFPFLFSIMFGDLGHGFIMFLFGLYLVLFEKKIIAMKIDEEMFTMIFGGRYVILLMGAFSMYSGLLYNDIFSRPLNIFGSSWSADNYSTETLENFNMIMLNPNSSDFVGHPYAIGLDPAWQISQNKITFLNSFKMKLSVIFGLVQMMFGVVLSLFNHRYFNRPLNIYCEFIPQMVFMVCIFGYLWLLIFVKWLSYGPEDSPCAPSLLIHLINMFLMQYSYCDTCGGVCVFYAGQEGFQKFLLIIALMCIPVMLLSKPILMRQQHLKGGIAQPPAADHDGEANGSVAVPTGGEVGHAEHFDFGEELIHQTIHTIEYCLGLISHTASYLRLWALSLAHAQLSEVLWGMVLQIGLHSAGNSGGIVLFIVFAPWAVLTVGVLLFMEGLSAFLHTIRLHWVEFQSKFYQGTGYMFTPFSFDQIVEGRVED